MIIKECSLKGVFEIQLETHDDYRGFFMRVYDDKIFQEHGIHHQWVQENHALSLKKGIIRGFHFQFPPEAETKLIRVVRGEILDAYLDLRKNSETFGKCGSVRLSAKNKKMLYLPQGFAHAYCSLTDNCEVVYKVDTYYSPKSEGTVKWNDPKVGFEWPVSNPIVSKKDSEAPGLQEFIDQHKGLELVS